VLLLFNFEACSVFSKRSIGDGGMGGGMGRGKGKGLRPPLFKCISSHANH